MTFLSTKQVIDLLNIDRTTLYRMLKDGRLNGVKVGSQWRFKEDEVNRLISGDQKGEFQNIKDLDDSLPLSCILPIQDVIADIAGIGVVITDNNARQLTEISNPCEFCQLVRSSVKGKAACDASWEYLVSRDEEHAKFIPCHAGLKYAKAGIRQENGNFGVLIAGQFVVNNDSRTLDKTHIKQLAEKYDLDAEKLANAAAKVQVLDQRWENKIESWLAKIASTFESVIRERNTFISRFKQIVNIIDAELPH